VGNVASADLTPGEAMVEQKKMIYIESSDTPFYEESPRILDKTL